jgi:uncharacterized protein YndB with AHSA1/START domain
VDIEPPVVAIARRAFSAPAEALYDAWLDPAQVERWFAPGLGPMVHVEIDARVGGAFSFVQRRGDQNIDHAGEYLELDRPRRLVFSWSVVGDPSPPSQVSVEIAPTAAGCEVTVRHEMDASWAEFVPQAAAAWGRMIEAMATG